MKLFRQKTVKEIHNSWIYPDEENTPEKYIPWKSRSKFLCDVITKHTYSNKINILELGCNVGRNLDYLRNAGFGNLTGVDINQDALDLFSSIYPETYKNVKTYCSSIEDIIGDFKDNQFDVTFTIAVLEHIHPDSKFVFGEMIRISKMIILIEDTKTKSWQNFRRDYSKIFGKDMEELESRNCKDVDGFNDLFTLKVFKRKA